jgi:hypothetical protein
MVGRHLIKRGCKLEVEVPTSRGRSADFRVTRDNDSFYVPIKRLDLEQKIQNELRVKVLGMAHFGG